MKNKITLFIVTALFLFNTSLHANGLSLNSVGPRAFGMGGAFVGLANDYSAIYWNPAGLSLLKGNYISIFGTDVIPMSTYKNGTIDTETKTNHYISPNLMGYISFQPAADLTIGLGVYVPSGLGAEWDGADLKGLVGNTEVEWMSKIAVFNISPVIAYKFNENISVGAAFNLYYGMFDLKRPAAIPGVGVFQYSEESAGLGFGVTVGALVKVNEMISIGASFRTKSTVTMNGDAENTGFAAIGYPKETEFDRDVAWPMWVAGGIAFKPIDNLTLALDAQFSQWSESEDEFITEFKDPTWIAATTPNDQNKFILKWKDATQIRFGVEYNVNEALDLRAGFYTDPAPAPDETYNILFPSIDYNGITIGGSYQFNQFNFDLGAEYLIGKDRDIVVTPHSSIPGTYGANIMAFTFGVGYQF